MAIRKSIPSVTAALTKLHEQPENTKICKLMIIITVAIP